MKKIWNWFKTTKIYQVTPYWVAHGLVEQLWSWLKTTKIYQVTPYWVAHGLVALAISLVTGFWLSGTMFYIGRELRDVEKLHDWDWKKFDWPGLLAPAVVSLIILLSK